MSKKVRFNKRSMIALACAVTVVGVVVMSVTNVVSANAHRVNKKVVTTSEFLKLPAAGMGCVIDNYIGATSGSSVEFLSNTALASSLTDTYNEYYDANGSTIGKLIVYNGEETLSVYDKMVGTERVERGDTEAQVVGHMRRYDAATLVRVQGDWYQIVSNVVNGFVKKQDFLRGVDAEGIHEKTYLKAAYAKNSEVLMYSDPWDYSTVLCVLPAGIRYTFIEYGEPFSKIKADGVGEGWVNNEDMTYETVRRFASSVAIEKEAKKRIDEGLSLAEEIENGKAAEAALYERWSINIAPAAPDSEDIAALRQAIASYATQFVGVLPYVWGSSDLSYGADCSGFTSAIYRAYGIEISRSSDAQTWGGMSVSIDDVRPGDIVCYPGHVAMYVGDGMVVHEPSPGRTASYADMYMMPIINIARYIN